MSEQNRQVVRQLFEDVWNNQNFARVDGILTPDYRHHDPATPDLGVGPEGYRKLLNLYTSAFPDIHFNIADLIAESDRVVARWTATGTHKGVLNGLAPTGKRFNITGVCVFRLTNGKISEEFVIWDALGCFQQLGVIPETQRLGRAA